MHVFFLALRLFCFVLWRIETLWIQSEISVFLFNKFNSIFSSYSLYTCALLCSLTEAAFSRNKSIQFLSLYKNSINHSEMKRREFGFHECVLEQEEKTERRSNSFSSDFFWRRTYSSLANLEYKTLSIHHTHSHISSNHIHTQKENFHFCSHKKFKQNKCKIFFILNWIKSVVLLVRVTHRCLSTQCKNRQTNNEYVIVRGKNTKSQNTHSKNQIYWK